MSSLVEIVQHMDNLLAQAARHEELGEEVPPELIEIINELVTVEAGKVDNCASYIEHAKSQIAWLKQEKEYIDAHIRRFQRSIDRIKERAKFVLESRGVNSIEGLRGHKFYLKNNESVQFTDESQLPGKVLVTSTRPDKVKIKELIKSGEVVMGAYIKQSKSVVVK